MLDRIQRLQRTIARQWSTSARRSSRSTRANSLRHLRIEGLEDRVVLATNSWLPNGGGIWESPANWSLGRVPTAADDVVITPNSAGTITLSDPTDVANSVTTNTNAALQLNKSFTMGPGVSTFNSTVNVVAGSTFSIAANAQVAVNNVSIVDAGVLNIGANSKFTFTGGSTTPGTIRVTGVANVQPGSSFTGGTYTGISVGTNGELISKGAKYALPGVSLSSSSILTNTDLQGNDFSATTLSLPGTFIPLVANRTDNQGNDLSNIQFAEVDIQGGTLTSGTPLQLTAMGTGSKSLLFYRFVGGYNIANGAILNVDPQLRLVLTQDTSNGPEGTTIVVNGTMNLTPSDSVSLYTNPAQNSPVGRIIVANGGTLRSTGGPVDGQQVVFNNAALNPGSAGTSLNIQAGGTLIASQTTFAIGGTNLSPGSNIGTIANPLVTDSNFVGTVLSLPVTYVPILANHYDTSGNLISSNKQFGEIDLLGDSPITGNALSNNNSIELTAMGSAAGAKNTIFYRLPDRFTIDAGSSLTVDPNLRIYAYFYGDVLYGSTLIVNGNLTLGSGDTLTFHTGPLPTDATKPGQTSQLLVGSTGVVTATGTNFLTEPGSFPTTMRVSGGGTLAGSGNDFATTTTTLLPNAVITDASGNPLLTNNQFAATTLAVAATSVPALTQNQQFSEVDLYTGTLTTTNVPSGILNLTKMGTVRNSTIFYSFIPDPTLSPNNPNASTFIVSSGVTLNFDPNLAINLYDITLQVDGTVNFGSNDTVALYRYPGDPTTNPVTPPGAPSQIVVNGTVDATRGGFLLNNPRGGSATALTVNSGGTFKTVGATLAPTNINLTAGSTDSITITAFGQPGSGTTLTVDSGATINITQNNLTATPAIVATGNPNTTINMVGNYWGSTDRTTIEAKIFDHNDETPPANTLPTILIDPYYQGTSATFAQNVSTVFASTGQTIKLTANVIPVAGTIAPINEGTLTFTLFNGTTIIGTAQAAPVNGQVSVSIDLPPGLPVGLYPIQVSYDDGSSYDYTPSVDTSKFLSVTQAPTAVVAPATTPSTSYSAIATENVPISISVVNTGVTGDSIGEGIVTFTVFTTGDTPTQVGSSFSLNVTGGLATGSIPLPLGTPGGTYTVNAVFTGARDYANSAVTSFTITVNPAATQVAVSPASASFSTSDQTLTLTAIVTSAAGTVGEGTLNFALVGADGVTVGTPVSGTVVIDPVTGVGTATVLYVLPARSTAGSDTIFVSYSGTNNFADSALSASTLSISKANTAITVTSTSAQYNTATTGLELTANVTSNTSQVNEGNVIFGVYDAANNLLGAISVASVVNGKATANYQFPGNLPVGSSYSLQAVYVESPDYNTSVATPGTVTIIQATTALTAFIAPIIYNPAAQAVQVGGIVLDNGVPVNQGSVTFTIYNGSTALVTSAPVALTNGSAATAVSIPGAITAGTALTVVVRYDGNVNYSAGTASKSTVISQATPVVAFNSPAPIVFGTPLSSTQLNATASVPGTFNYSPAAGTVLRAGAGQVLSVGFFPTDGVDYTTAATATTITVVQATPTFSLLSPSQAIAFGTAGVTLYGRLAAPTAIPVGESVAIVLSSPTQSTSAVATINPDGTFATTVPTSALTVGGYSVRLAYAGDANFLPASADGGTVAVTQAPQSIVPFAVPTSITYGSSFLVNPVTSVGLPAVVTATNAIVTPALGGGYLVTATSGTLPVVVTASQAGNGNYLPATVAQVTVPTVKAQASIVLVPNFGIVYDGLPHGVGVTTNPPNLGTIVTYTTADGTPVAAPTLPGTYAVAGAINDPNYQGTAFSTLVIVPAITPTPVPPGGGGTVAIVSVAGVTLTTNAKTKSVTAINVTFTGAPNAGQLVNLGNYRLATAGARGSFDAKNARTYRFSTATYNAATNTVTVRLAKAQKLGPAYQFRVSNVANTTVNARINKKGGVSL